jgi:hypothetical protein
MKGGGGNIEFKISKFLKITGLISTILKPPAVQRHTAVNIYETAALTTLYAAAKTG